MRRFLVCSAAAAGMLLYTSTALAAIREAKGHIVELSTSSIAVQPDVGKELSCVFGPGSPRAAGVRQGDVVQLSCGSHAGDPEHPVWYVGAVSGKNGRTGPGTYSFTRNGLQIVQGMLIAVAGFTPQHPSFTDLVIRPQNGGPAVHCAAPSVSGILTPPTWLWNLRMACRDGVFVSVDRTWNLVSDAGLVVVSGTVASASPTALRIQLRYGGTQTCGYGPLSPAPSDFTPGDEIAVQCDTQHQLSELSLLKKPGLTWVLGAGVDITSGGVMTVAVGGTYDLVKCRLLHYNPKDFGYFAGQYCSGDGIPVFRDIPWVGASGPVVSITDSAITVRKHDGVTVTTPWSLDATQCVSDFKPYPKGTDPRDVFHVGDFVDVSTNNYGPYPADGVAAVIGFRSPGTHP